MTTSRSVAMVMLLIGTAMVFGRFLALSPSGQIGQFGGFFAVTACGNCIGNHVCLPDLRLLH